MSPDLYDLKGAAAYLDTTEERVRELIATGKLKAAPLARVGKRGPRNYRIFRRWLDECLDLLQRELAQQLAAAAAGPAPVPKRAQRVPRPAAEGGRVLRMPGEGK